MSWENYQKNKDAVEELRNKYIDINRKATLEPDTAYMCHCRCCEDLYIDLGSAILARNGDCYCGSFRLEVYNVK